MNTPTRIAYSVTAQSTGGRAGRATTADPELALDLRAPVELGGPGGGSNPEQLFAMGYGACFQGAMGLVAKDFGLDISESVVRTTIGIGPEGSSFALTAVIEVLVPGAGAARGTRGLLAGRRRSGAACRTRALSALRNECRRSCPPG